MAQTPPTEKEIASRITLLLEAVSKDALQLVDEDGRPVRLLDTWDTPTWAHLRDAEDGRVYVQPLRGSKELVQGRYLELLGLEV